MARRRILIVSYTIPENNMGGGLLLHRHFVQRTDYDIGVVTCNPAVPPNVFYRYVPEPALLSRLKRTRLSKWVHDYTHTIHASLGDKRLIAAADEFSPDVVFNVAETYLSFHALKLANKLGVPFVCYFMDWAHYASEHHTWLRPLIDRMYRQLYRESDLALCISEGMRDELGPHPNARVLHPIPARQSERTNQIPVNHAGFEFCFAGNLAHWYGRQVRALMERLECLSDVHMKVFGNHHSWPVAFEERHCRLGTYLGFRHYEDLISEFTNTDAFLLPMGFDQSASLIERTSFKTKFLDYIQYDKPVLIWGPEYCTAVRIARQYDSAYCVTDPDPDAAIQGMRRIAGDSELRRSLVQNASEMRKREFEADKIYAVLQQSLEELLQGDR